jgi:hypothetical protein
MEMSLFAARLSTQAVLGWVSPIRQEKTIVLCANDRAKIGSSAVITNADKILEIRFGN